jgi:inhibitor of KinA
MKCTFSPLGDNAVRMRFGNAISEETNVHIRKIALLLEKEKIKGIIEWTPTYTSISVYYNSLVIDYKELCKILKKLQSRAETEKLPPAREIVVPTCYGGKFGPDLENVATTNNLTVEEVISIHSKPLYLVYMLGFSPGFPYLGGMDKHIATPRLATPRLKIEAGSVGIADVQTGIYSIDSPGGWQIIGKTPLKLFDVAGENPFLLQAGDTLRFKSITEEEYDSLKGGKHE